jgi:hypothetical protein
MFVEEKSIRFDAFRSGSKSDQPGAGNELTARAARGSR